MKKAYDHKKIEKKWQTVWDKNKIYQASNTSKKKKFYGLIEFPYPSGAGLHVGHIRSNTAMDVISRKRRMEGYNVLYPIGWDAFGLPTENYAIKTGISPFIVTKKNTDTFRKQLKSLGFSFDWSREVNTTDPKYYKWTQWIFLQMFKKGLAYKAKINVNWCPKDKTGLANEEVVDGCCERCGTPVEKREKDQWLLRITKYADRLDKDLDTVDYLEKIKIQQRNWIGRSEGAEIDFSVSGGDKIKVFTTRPDTIFGATYMVLSPEHALVQKLKSKITNWSEVEKYISDTKNKVEIERVAENREKTGVELKGIKAINPASKEEIPIWIADYVLVNYGTGAIMAVPGHDERDFAFAKKYNLEIRYVVATPEPEQLYKPKVGLPFVYRKAVECYIRNPKTGEFLFLEWKTVANWRTPITGGIEDGEDLVGAARREIYEETGYKNLKFIKHLGTPMRADFFHPAKNENRRADFYGLFFELENDTKDEVKEAELAKHTPVWIQADKVSSFLTTTLVPFQRINKENISYGYAGILINSGKFNDLNSEEAKKEIIKFVGGKEKVTYKLRDWVFSRQRYWGEPIPVVHCESCGIVPVPEKDLPLKLPKVVKYQPTDTGESPLATLDKWVNTKCPKCKGKAKRETDTMPNWAGSSWYFLRYIDPKNNKAFASKKNLDYWLGVDPERGVGGVNWYNGGMEHTTLHLLYSRFWHKFLYDLKLVPTSEPYAKRTSHGLILADDGTKFSKSKGNGIDPMDLIKIYGADAIRMYEMFMGPFDQAVAWDTNSIVGPYRFLERVWKLSEKVSKSSHFSILKILNKTIKKVTEDIEGMRFNTAISSMMILSTEMERAPNISKDDYKKFLQILSPFAPHITEELWSMLGEKKSINMSVWPEWDKTLIQDDEVKIIVQINGKLRSEIMVPVDTSEEEVKKNAIKNEAVLKYVGGQEIKKIIYVKNRLINIVI
jgi:leucyl-tRNA synthetase